MLGDDVLHGVGLTGDANAHAATKRSRLERGASLDVVGLRLVGKAVGPEHVLATKAQATEATVYAHISDTAAKATDVGGSDERGVVRTVCGQQSVVSVETGFNVEVRLQTVAQIFGASDGDTRTVIPNAVTGLQARRCSLRSTSGRIGIDTQRHTTRNGHIRLRHRDRGSQGSGDSNRHQFLIHRDFSIYKVGRPSLY